MNIWLLMIIIGSLTFVGRLSFIVILGQREMPAWALTALRYVPVTALTALALPSIMVTDGTIDMSLNPKIFAGIIAILVAWKTKNLLFTITAGMVTFWVMAILIGV